MKGSAPQFLHLHRLALDVVFYATRRADDHVHAPPQRSLLRCVRAATVDTEGAEVARGADVLEVLVHL